MFEEGTSSSLLVTGISGFDAVLGGGLPRPGTYLLTGLAGTGKSVLANQIAYNAARRGETVVYATALAETHDQMISHISGMSFFDRDLVAARVHYVSLYEQIVEYGLSNLKDTVRRLVRDRQATIFILDGLAAIRDFASGDSGSYRHFLHDLNSQLVHLGLVSVFVSDADDLASSLDRSTPAEAIVDGLVWLRDLPHDLRDEREVRVRKLRGRAYLRGGHFFRIDESGISVFPRVEAAMRASATSIGAPTGWVRTGIEGLDALLGGGLLSGSAAAIAGEPGVGKTLTALSFLIDGANAGERCLYYGVHETPALLLEAADAVGLPLRHHVETGRITLHWRSPNENLPDELAHDIVNLVTQNQIERLVVDDLTHFLETALYPARIPNFLAALTNALRQTRVTTMLLVAIADATSSSLRLDLPTVSTIAETVIVLRYVQNESVIRRLISVRKSLATQHHARIYDLEITRYGLRVVASPRSEDLPATIERTTESTAINADAETRDSG